MEWELDEETGLQRREVPTDVLPESLLLLRNRRWLVGVPLFYHAACW